MKYLLCTLVALLCMSCMEVNIYEGFEMDDPYVLTEYNVVLYASADGDPICGATLTERGVVTAAHCVRDANDYHISPNNGVLYPVEITAINNFETSDLALLTPLGELPPQPMAAVETSEPIFGEDIWVIGCGGGVCDALSKGIVSKLNVIGHHNMPMNQFDVTAWYGNSGGGIFDNEGKLVGVVSQFGPQFDRGWYGGEPETGWMYGCQVKAIKHILEDGNPTE